MAGTFTNELNMDYLAKVISEIFSRQNGTDTTVTFIKKETQKTEEK
jgi:hypothetical protein